jgi:hypothetical protein
MNRSHHERDEGSAAADKSAVLSTLAVQKSKSTTRARNTGHRSDGTRHQRQQEQLVQKIDLRKELKQLYRPSAKEVVQVEVPTFRFLMIDGEGDPDTSPAYAQAVEALFSVSYTVKFAVKKAAQGIDYAVMPLEGLWWSDDMSAFITNDRSKWQWTMMIMQPHFWRKQ